MGTEGHSQRAIAQTSKYSPKL